MVDDVLALLHWIGRFAGLEFLDVADISSAVIVPSYLTYSGSGRSVALDSGTKSIKSSWQSSHSMAMLSGAASPDVRGNGDVVR
jgi:hypothetical protein